MIVVGIDPGTTGAIAFIHLNHGLIAVDDLPTQRTDGGTIKNQLDCCGLRDLIRRWVPADAASLFVIEHTSPFGKSALSSASLEATKASIRAVLSLGGFDTRTVTPQTWKKFYGLGGEKDDQAKKRASLEKARSFFGVAGLELAKHHNRAEAALIAHYGRRNFA